MNRSAWFSHLRRRARSTLLPVGTLAAIVAGSMLLLGPAQAQPSAALYDSLCSGCHDDVQHPKGLVYNAAGNAAMITAVNALGMESAGSPADFASVAAYLDSVKPTITLAPVAHDSPGTVIILGDIIVSRAVQHRYLRIVSTIETVSAPTKGTVVYEFGNGFGAPSDVIYTPFPGQSGVDTWTYQGSGPRGTTTLRTASVSIAAANGPPDAIAAVVEYYWATRDHYFISSSAAEIAALDAAPPGGWVRTGKTFKTLSTPDAGTSPVCRFYLPAQFGDSHFYGRGSAECEATHAKYPGFVYESPAVMYMTLPTLGTCGPGTIPVYRVFDGRIDANHRYTTDSAVRQQMVAQGWMAEGDGPDFVVMCAPQ